jgi:hypothetical protein
MNLPVNSYIVLDALIRELSERKKRGFVDPRVQFTVLLNRIIKENDDVRETSARPQLAKNLRWLIRDGFIEKEKIGRKVFYDVTAEGKVEYLSNRDKSDPHRKWYEAGITGLYYSYAVTPSDYGLIHERKSHSKLQNIDQLYEAIKQFKEKNPNLESIYLRLDEE